MKGRRICCSSRLTIGARCLISDFPILLFNLKCLSVSQAHFFFHELRFMYLHCIIYEMTCCHPQWNYMHTAWNISDCIDTYFFLNGNLQQLLQIKMAMIHFLYNSIDLCINRSTITHTVRYDNKQKANDRNGIIIEKNERTKRKSNWTKHQIQLHKTAIWLITFYYFTPH